MDRLGHCGGLPEAASDAVGARTSWGERGRGRPGSTGGSAAAAGRPASCRAAAPCVVQGLDRVGRAGRVEPAARAEQRREDQLVAADREHQQPARRRRLTRTSRPLTAVSRAPGQRPVQGAGRAGAELAARRRRAAPGRPAGCRPGAGPAGPAAGAAAGAGPGCGPPPDRPPGAPRSRPAGWRPRRRRRRGSAGAACRTTIPSAARGARAAQGRGEVGERRSRAAAGSTSVRPRARSGPCGAGRRGSPGRPGCACAGGSRASWPDGGCSAGTCACSLVGSRTGGDRACAPGGGAHAWHREVPGSVASRGRLRGRPGRRRGTAANTRRARRSSRRRLDRATVRAAARPGSNRVRARQPTTGRPVIVAGHGPRTGATRPGRGGRRVRPAENCRCGLWTTACWRSAGLVSVSRVAGRSPAGRHRRTLAVATVLAAGPGRVDRTGRTGATYVHRLWTTVWTATGGALRRPGSRRLAPRLGTMLGTQSPPPGSGPVTTDTVRTARTREGPPRDRRDQPRAPGVALQLEDGDWAPGLGPGARRAGADRHPAAARLHPAQPAGRRGRRHRPARRCRTSSPRT